MRLIAMTPPERLEGEINIINSLFNAGLKQLHLRKPGWSIGEVQSYLQGIQQEHHRKISLHSHHDLTKSFALKGLHFTTALCHTLGNASEAEKKLQAWKDLGCLVSRPVHDMDTLIRAGQQYDYVLASPVFESISKKGHLPRFHWNVNEVKKQLSCKLIALGGVHDGNITSAHSAGFDGVALLGYLWEKPRMAVEKFKRVQSICRHHVHLY